MGCGKSWSVEVRHAVALAVEQGHGPAKIARDFNLKYHTVKTVVAKLKRGEGIKPSRKGERTTSQPEIEQEITKGMESKLSLISRCSTFTCGMP